MKFDHQALPEFIIIIVSIVIAISAVNSIAAQIPTPLQQQALSTHNQLRHQHHSPNLTWSNELATYAERHANHCEFKHSHGPYGENIAAGYPSIKTAITKWYDENQLYSYKNPGFSHQTGHFTQVVWKSSTKLGCAYVACHGKNGTPGNFLVCEYSPAGNVVSADENFFVSNVLPQASQR